MNAEAGLPGHLFLTILDGFIMEFEHLAALVADDVVMVLAPTQLEYRVTAFEMMAMHQAGTFKLGQNTIHRRQTDILTRFQQALVDIFRAQMTLGFITLENLEDFHARQGDL